MTWQQISKLWEDYGPGALIVLIIVILIVVAFWAIRTLIRWWPVITQFVSTINIVANLPKRLDKIDSDNNSIHMTLEKVDARLISVEKAAGVAADNAAVAAERADVAAAQLRRNGGSTIKDKIDKVPVTLDQIVALLQELKDDRPLA